MATLQTLLKGLLLFTLSFSTSAVAGGGPLGIDYRLSRDDNGIWKRSNQEILVNGLIAGEIIGAVWEGGEDRVGKTFWQSIDASVLGEVGSESLKLITSRARPSQGNDPNLWFEGKGRESFPSGEVTMVSAIVTPFVLEYGHDDPTVYALELLPLYDAIARMKSQAHWQTDVLAGFILGTTSGYYAHNRESPLVLGVLPHGFAVGWHASF